MFFDGEMADLRFSIDTLRFDTVFTTVGSATKFVKIFNQENEAIVLDRVGMQEGANSFFRLNIDGTPSIEMENVEIPANDSIWVFVEVTVDPDAPLSASPFVIEEFLEVTFQEQSETVLFEAWGQNANYFTGRDAAGRVSVLTCDMGEFVLDDPRPYVIHGILVIDSCELVIPAGTDIFIHGGIAINETGIFNDGLIAVLGNGSIRANGTIEEPISFQGDRLESEFLDVPGQWVGLRFFNESTNNSLQYTSIKNSIIGMRLDSAAQISMNNTQVFNTSTSGITAVHANIDMSNCLLFNNGTNALQLVYGGNYNIDHCTFYNSINQDPSLAATNFVCRDNECTIVDVFSMNLNVSNSIISGTNEDEILLVDFTDGSSPQDWQINWNNNILKVDEILLDELDGPVVESCESCLLILNNDSLFVDRENFDLHLDTLSRAIDIGIGNQPIDLEATPRDDSPDIGCYEYVF